MRCGLAEAGAVEPAYEVRRIAMKLAALSQNGLTFAVGEYDADRYRQMQGLAADLQSVIDGRPSEDFRLEMGRDAGYATPKVDVRGYVFDESDRVLMIRERADGMWAVPGGWADPGDRPSVAVAREIREETGYQAAAVKLAGCWDRDLHGHTPVLPVHVYKLAFLCELSGDRVAYSSLETLDVGWFDVDALPPLSPARVTEDQIKRVLRHHRDRALATEFD